MDKYFIYYCNLMTNDVIFMCPVVVICTAMSEHSHQANLVALYKIQTF